VPSPESQDPRITNAPYAFERDQSFTEDRCFLCGTSLDSSNRTDEHVFPQWLLRKFDLWRQELILLNGTGIPYSQLLIPCCAPCNNDHLSQVENRVKSAFEGGPSAVRALDRTDLFVWLAKIYYGLQFRDMFLRADRADPRAGAILTPEWLEQFRMHHMLMQAARGVVRWDPSQFPASIFIFECQVPSDPKRGFDYRDALQYPYLALRIGSTGIVASLQDWGSMADLDIPMFEAARRIMLHPRQFHQVDAMAGYLTTLFDRTPSHLTIHRDTYVDIHTLPIGGLSGRPIFRDFQVEEYAEVFADRLQQPVDDIYDGSRVADVVGRDERPFEFPFSADDMPGLAISRPDERDAPST
jgi:hypothetical protein